MRALRIGFACTCLGSALAAVAVGCGGDDSVEAQVTADGGDTDGSDAIAEVPQSFGDSGFFTWGSSNARDHAGEAIVRQSDGKLVAVGAGSDYVDVVRFTPSGEIDESFGGAVAGHAVVGGLGNMFGGRVALAPDGKLLVLGISRDDFRVMVVRLDANGAVDPTWGTDGIIRFSTGAPRTDAYDFGIAVQSDGKVIVAGGYAPDATVMRFDSDGKVDTGFGSAGTAAMPVDVILRDALVIDSMGRVLVGAETVDHKGEVIRLTSAGLPDPTFDGDGIAAAPNIGGVTALATDSAGHVYVGGNIGPADFEYFERLDANGAIDVAFNNGQTILTPTQIIGVAVDANERPLVFTPHAIQRFDTNGAADETFATNGKRTFSEPFSKHALVLPDMSPVNVGFLSDGLLCVAKRTPSGTDDTTFGDAGYASTTGISGAREVATMFETTADGKTIVLASSDTFLGTTMLRVTSDGRLDTTFGTDGVIAMDQRYFNGLAVDATGRALLLQAATGSFVIRRYDLGGNVDSSFGNADGGGKEYSVPNGYAYAMGSHPDGRLVVAGVRDNDIFVYRVDANGTPDATFKGGVSFVSTGSSGTTTVASVLGLADGTVVVGAVADGKPAAIRFAATGGAFPGFGGSGVAKGVSDVRRVRAVGVQPNGSIVVLAKTDDAKDDYVIERFDAGGGHDSTFGANGVVSHAEGHREASSVEGPDMAVDATGRLYVATVARENGHDEMAVFRYTEGGQPDPTWGPNGRRIFTKSIGVDAARGIRILPNGSLMIGGRMFTQTGASDLALARVIP